MHIRRPASDDAYSLFKLNLESNIPNHIDFDLVKEDKTTITSGQTAYYHVHTFRSGEVRFKNMVAWVFNDWNAYQFSFDCLPDNWVLMEPVFMKIIGSLRIKLEVLSLLERNANFLKNARQVKANFDVFRPTVRVIRIIDIVFKSGVELLNVRMSEDFLVTIPSEFKAMPVESIRVPDANRQSDLPPMLIKPSAVSETTKRETPDREGPRLVDRLSEILHRLKEKQRIGEESVIEGMTIHDAVRADQLATVQALLNGDPHRVFSRDDASKTPLHWAALYGYKGAAALLLAKKAEVDAKDIFGERPLHKAAANGKPGMVDFLLSMGADVNAKDTPGGWTPLRHAAFRREEYVAALLRRHGGHE
jgi:hypothetical protein